MTTENSKKSVLKLYKNVISGTLWWPWTSGSYHWGLPTGSLPLGVTPSYRKGDYHWEYTTEELPLGVYHWEFKAHGISGNRTTDPMNARPVPCQHSHQISH